VFVFNHAPFHQTFMEVRLERSKQRVMLALHGAVQSVDAISMLPSMAQRPRHPPLLWNL